MNRKGLKAILIVGMVCIMLLVGCGRLQIARSIGSNTTQPSGAETATGSPPSTIIQTQPGTNSAPANTKATVAGTPTTAATSRTTTKTQPGTTSAEDSEALVQDTVDPKQKLESIAEQNRAQVDAWAKDRDKAASLIKEGALKSKIEIMLPKPGGTAGSATTASGAAPSQPTTTRTTRTPINIVQPTTTRTTRAKLGIGTEAPTEPGKGWTIDFGKAKEGTAFTVPVKDMEIPVVNRLGCGYNVFGQYASNSSVKEPVLDLRRLLETNRVEAKSLNNFENYETISESIRGYVKDTATSVGISGGFMCFKGSVDTYFSSQQREETKNYFASFERVVQQYQTYIKGMTNYKDYLIKEVKTALDSNIEPRKIFDVYGHYILVNGISGGKLIYTVTNTSTSSKSFSNFKVDVKASFNAVLASAGGSISTQGSTEKSSYDLTSKSNLFIQGGTFFMLPNEVQNKPEVVRQWIDSLKSETNALVAFPKDTTSLIPIWDLCSNPDRAKQLRAAFEAEAERYKNSLPMEAHFRLKYVTAINIGLNEDAQKARAEAAKGSRTVLEPELNQKAGGHYIYLGIQYGAPGDMKGAITDLLISTENKGSWFDFAHHENTSGYILVRKNDQASGSYTPKWCDLNYKAGGEYLYLYASFAYAPRKAPIYDIMVYDATEKTQDPNNDYDRQVANVKEFAAKNNWEIVNFAFSETPANLNHDAGGNRLFLLVKKDYSMILPPD